MLEERWLNRKCQFTNEYYFSNVFRASSVLSNVQQHHVNADIFGNCTRPSFLGVVKNSEIKVS